MSEFRPSRAVRPWGSGWGCGAGDQPVPPWRGRGSTAYCGHGPPHCFQAQRFSRANSLLVAGFSLRFGMPDSPRAPLRRRGVGSRKFCLRSRARRGWCRGAESRNTGICIADARESVDSEHRSLAVGTEHPQIRDKDSWGNFSLPTAGMHRWFRGEESFGHLGCPGIGSRVRGFENTEPAPRARSGPFGSFSWARASTRPAVGFGGFDLPSWTWATVLWVRSGVPDPSRRARAPAGS